MSFLAHEPSSSSSSGSEEEKRAQRLASARKKLHTFRASRSSETSDPAPIASSSSSSSKTSSPSKMMPLTTEASINSPFSFPQSHSRSSSKENIQDFAFETPAKPSHRHKRSDSQAHRRQRSSIAIPSGMTLGQGLARPTVMGVFDAPKEIITTPATPLLESPDIPPEPSIEPDENHEEVAARLSTFSFGSKPPTSTFPPKRRQHSLKSSQSLFAPEVMPSTSPLASPTSSASVPNLNRLSTPLSRPPSFLLTQATPFSFGSPTSSAPTRTSLASLPSSPPTPARKRHSHTRSNSISLPNLKLGGTRPNSLGIPHSNSIPSSPCSPTSTVGESSNRPTLTSPVTAQRLKFEPSGRGAEAEKEREESRRKALEKLTGGPTLAKSPVMEPQISEISLPDLDDEDTSSVASSNRPLSGAFGSGSGSSFFSRPSSLTLPPLTSSTTSTSSALSSSPFSWGSPNEQQSPTERWSGFGFGLAKDYVKEETVNFGMDISTAMAKRPSINRQLSALAEVDESEEDEGDFADNEEPTDMARTFSDEPDNILPPLQIEPTPNRLRELRLGSSISSSTPRQESVDGVHTFSFPRQSSTSPSATSPTKAYGSIGRGRPKPLQINSTHSTPSSSMTTPKSAGFSSRKRAAPGSRGSSISYKKDDSSSSSHDLSIGNGRSVFSPEAISPPPGSPKFSGWGNNAARSSARPCPRPRTLVGLGIDNTGFGRVLGELDEVDEENSPTPKSVAMWTSPIPDEHNVEDDDEEDYPTHGSRDSLAEKMSWKDVQLEMEMEREALREDVELWKIRCANLEEKLDIEKKESTILRERVRKLGDRLSSVSSVPTERSSSDSHATESRLIAEMREQLFHLTTSLEVERKAKENALAKLAELKRPSQQQFEDVLVDDELTLTAKPDYNNQPPTFVASADATFYPIIEQPSPPTVENHVLSISTKPLADPNLARMQGWGFPKEPSPTKSQLLEKSKKRESFFGLSTVLKRSVSADEAETHNGVDLPCFVLPNDETVNTTSPIPYQSSLSSSTYGISSTFEQNEFTPRSISEPIWKKQPKPVERSNPNETVHTINSPSSFSSTSGFTNSAVSFISSYLPTTTGKSSLDESHSQQQQQHQQRKEKTVYIPKFINKESQQRKVSQHHNETNMAKLDYRHSCKCCTGPIIEL
ncbi:uncharacterized protein L201_003526 [Kwoniella dendrophila CBS 6074]|uniref:Uncharacterized protein n=1 Tax=Kwoniella dendrophila CBS 6074 TaxID=1295534 RepID=A0AAX4JUZ0_9TREE